MSDNKKKNSSKKSESYGSGLGGNQDGYSALPKFSAKKIKKVSISAKKDEPRVEVKKDVEVRKVEPKRIVKKTPEVRKVVVPKVIKKDPELEKDIIKVVQEVPKEELERLLRPSKESKDKLVKMDFQNREDMSEEEKRDFIEQVAKREPEPEIAEINGAMVWKWQKNRRMSLKKDLKKNSKNK